jgi:hypothetical protein
MRFLASGPFHQIIPTRPLIHALKYFQISLKIRCDINKNVVAQWLSPLGDMQQFRDRIRLPSQSTEWGQDI